MRQRRAVSRLLTSVGGRLALLASWAFFLCLPAALAEERDGSAEPLAAHEEPEHAGAFSALPGEVEQIPPVSPFAAANDPNASSEGLYVIQSDIEDEAQAVAAANGVLKPNGKPAGTTPAARRARPTRFTVDPNARIAFSKSPMPYLTMSAYASAGSAFFEEYTSPAIRPFEARSGTLNGGVTANANLGFVNTNLTYDHSQPYRDFYTSRRYPGDGVGATFSKTLPFFVTGLVVNPSLSVRRAISNPITGLTDGATLNLGFSYKLTPTIDVSVAPTYGWTFNTELPGYKRTNGYGTVGGLTYKPLANLILSAALATGYSANYGIPSPDKRRNLNVNPTVKAQYSVTSILTVAVQAGYGQTWSNTKAANTYKYNIVPSVAVSIPL